MHYRKKKASTGPKPEQEDATSRLIQYQCGEPFNKATSDDAPWTKAKASGVN
uniref:Uncharacterized protein n=1 Tax=Vitis vinifera TaxID=29760 RepID=F6HZX5_VITVI